jgi:response regulator RpfG family c-di-GMP phosphodiesterase
VSAPLKTALLERLLAERRITAQQQQRVLAYAQAEGVRVEDALVECGVLDELALLKWLAAYYKLPFVSTEKLGRADVERSTLALIPRALAEKHLVFPVVFDPREASLAFVLADPEQPDIARDVRLQASVPHVKPLIARPAAIRAAISKHYGGDIYAFGKVEQRANQQLQDMLTAYERQVFDEPGLSMHPGPATLVSDGPPTGVMRALSAHTPPSPPPPKLPPPVPPRGSLRAPQEPPALPPAAPPPPSSATGASYASSIELVNVLVSLLENQRQELRGHSAQVARLMQKVGEHMGLPASDIYALRLCGLLHDVGKTSSYHLTALNVSEYEGHRTQALKCHLVPVRLFEVADLPKMCVEGLTHVYERFDGQGFPDRKAGKEIPLAARLLAVAETYADLTSNARNPFRKTLTAKGAVEVLKRYKDRVFDPNLVDLFRVAALGEEMQSSLLDDRPRILLVDADAEETTVLELRLVEQGYEVVLCRSAEQAYKVVQQGSVDALITEVDLAPNDGFTLVEYVRKHPQGGELPVFFLTRRSDRSSVDRGFQLGAADYIIKPAAPDVVVAKVRNVLSREGRRRVARGVSGSLSEMPLPDVLQVLSRTRKTGALRVSAGGHSGEIQFGNGAVYNASFRGHRGAEAVYALLTLTHGEFALDPSFVPTTRTVHESTESLLLEGMRRMDEQGATTPVDFSVTHVDD